MPYPTDKETFPRRDTNDIIPKEDNNNPVDFLERLQETLGYGADSPFPFVKAMFMARCSTTASATKYSMIYGNFPSSTYSEYPVGIGGKLKGLYGRCSGTMAVGSSVTLTVLKNGSPTSITLTFTSADGTSVKSDIVNEVAVVAGDTICIEVKETLGVSPVATINATFNLY